MSAILKFAQISELKTQSGLLLSDDLESLNGKNLLNYQMTLKL